MNSRIRILRKSLGLTQERFGEKMYVKGNTVAQWESGRNDPSESSIKYMCQVFKVNEKWLKYGVGDMFLSVPLTSLEKLAEEYQLDHASYVAVEKFVTLDPKMRTCIIAYLASMIDEIRNAENVKTSTFSSVIDTSADEAEYRKNLGIAPRTDSTALNTIDAIDAAEKSG